MSKYGIRTTKKQLQTAVNNIETLHIIFGVNVITTVKILSEIGDINRFFSADKLAQFAGIASLKLSSVGKGKDRACKQGTEDYKQRYISLQFRWCRFLL